MDTPTIEFVGESAVKIQKKRGRPKLQKSNLPDSAKTPRKKRKTKPKLSTNVPSSANMNPSSQIPGTSAPTPPMFPPHGLQGHGDIHHTPPSMMIPASFSGLIQTGASPSSRQVMDMAPMYPHLSPFLPQHMQSGNHPYQSMSPLVGQLPPPPQQQHQPHPLTHGSRLGNLQSYNFGAQTSLQPQANMLLGSSPQGGASSFTMQNPSMKTFTGAQNINDAAMTPLQSQERAEPNPLADYKFEYETPKDPNELAEHQKNMMKGMQRPYQPRRSKQSSSGSSSSGPSPSAPPFFEASSFPQPSPWPPSSGPSSFGASRSGPSISIVNANDMALRSQFNGQPSRPSMSLGNANNMTPQHQFQARSSGASMPVINSNTMAAPQQYLLGQPHFPMQMINSNIIAAQQQHFNSQPSGASASTINWNNINMAAQRQQIQVQIPFLHTMQMGSSNNMVPHQQHFNIQPSGISMPMVEPHNMASQRRQTHGQSFQPATQIGNSSQQQHFSPQPSSASRPATNSNNMADRQPQIHGQSFQPTMEMQMGNLNNMVTQQQSNTQPSGASTPRGNATNMAAQQHHVQGQPFQPTIPTVKLNDLEPVSASNPRNFTFEESQTLDLLSRIREDKLQAGREPESWEHCSEYFRQCHKWSPDIQMLQTLHQGFLADKYYYFGEVLRGISGFMELPPLGQGPSREVLNFFPGARQGWDTRRVTDQHGNLVKSEWASQTDNIIAQIAAETGLQWDLPNINRLGL